MDYYGSKSFWGIGIVEDISDPLKAGRVRVRVYGIHTADTSVLRTSDLPWSQVMMPVSSASISNVGTAPVGIQKGSMVYGVFLDHAYQQFLVQGTLAGKKKTTSIQEVMSESSLETIPIEEFGNSNAERVYNYSRSIGLSEKLAIGLISAITTEVGLSFNPSTKKNGRYGLGLFNQKQKNELREIASRSNKTIDDIKIQVDYIVSKIRNTDTVIVKNGDTTTSKKIETPYEASQAIIQQFYRTSTTKNSSVRKKYAEQAEAAYSPVPNDENTGSYQEKKSARDLEKFDTITSEEMLVSYLEFADSVRQYPTARIKGLIVHCTESYNDESYVNTKYIDDWMEGGIQYHFVINRDGRLQIGLPSTKPSNLPEFAEVTITEAVEEEERLRDYVNELFYLGGGETGNIDNLENLDMLFERKVIALLKDYRAAGNPVPTLTSGFRTAEEQAILRGGGTSYITAEVGKSRHERGQALDFNSSDVERMKAGGYLDAQGLWQRYGKTDPVHIEELGGLRDIVPWPNVSNLKTKTSIDIQKNTLQVVFVGGINSDSGQPEIYSKDSYTTAQWKAFNSLVRSFQHVFPDSYIIGRSEVDQQTEEPYFNVKDYVLNMSPDAYGIDAEVQQPVKQAAIEPEIEDPVETPVPSENEPSVIVEPESSDDIEDAPAGDIELETIEIPEPPSPSSTPIISVNDLLVLGTVGIGAAIDAGLTGSSTGSGTSTGGNADTLNNQAGSYYLDFTNFTNKPSPVLTATGAATGTATFTSLGNATLNLTIADNLALGGIPTAPTAGNGTNTTQLATTAFVQQELAGAGVSSNTTANTTSTVQTSVYTFAIATYHGAEFVITANDTVTGDRTITKLLVTHDGTTAIATQYGTLETTGSLASYDVDINTGNVRLLVTAASANNTDYVIHAVLL